MNSYACYPKSRTRFQAPFAGFNNPHFSHFANEAAGRFPLSSRPAANILREEGSYKIQLAVPGFSKEQIKIELHEGQLIITAKSENQESTPKFVRREFDYAGFKRAFRLHKNADASAMTASFEQGILTIVIPDATPETIKINIQ